MKLKQYIKNLQKFVKENPDAADYEVIYAKDSEGNGYNPVTYDPSLGSYADRDFVQDDGTKEFKEEFEVNAVCIN